MRVLIINSVCGIKSTGRICTDLANEFEKNGNEVKIAYGRDTVPEEYVKYAVKIGSDFDLRLHGVKSRLFDRHGLGSARPTRKFLKWADKFDPDVLWLHNLHGYYINYKLLFNWIKSRPEMKVKWTLHDCWAFTGHCTHFTYVNCDKWQSGCEHCPQLKEYPKSIWRDNSHSNFDQKKVSFTGVKNMSVITPSNWLSDLAKKSFLGEYRIETIKNKIDTTVFKPTFSDFRKNNNLQSKRIILGVASEWTEKKGLNDFIKLSGMLNENHEIVLVGTLAQKSPILPNNILFLGRTESKKKLAEIYTAADVFVNLTYEDTSSCVNLEAQACGTPVFTYDTGGCPETIYTKNSKIVKTGNLLEIRDLIFTLQ